jgi:hypothetical protein
MTQELRLLREIYEELERLGWDMTGDWAIAVRKLLDGSTANE